MRRDASRLRLDQADDKVALVHGAPWIRYQIEQQSLPLEDVGLALYPLADNVHQARRGVYGEDPPEVQDRPGQQWAAAVLHTAKHEGYEGLRKQLLAWKTSLRGVKKRQAVEQVLA
jgi:hypothetical protein